MRPYFRVYESPPVVGRRTRLNCDGTMLEWPKQAGNYPIRGSHKDAARRSNGILATDYSATWISEHHPALAYWEDNLDNTICYDIVGTRIISGIPNPIYKARILWAFNKQPITSLSLPLKYLWVTSFRNTTGSADITTAFNKVRSDTVNDHLNKIKDQKAMSLVSLAESRQTISLVRSLSKDVGAALLFVARGIISPKSAIDTYLKYAKRNGLRRPDKAQNLRSRDRKFIRNMQGYYKKHPQQHAKAISSISDSASQRWLQYRYGIGPLMGDLSAAHDYVYTKWHKFIHSNHIVVKFKFKRENSLISTNTSDGISFEGNSVALCQHISRFYISNQVARHAQKTGFSPSELLNTAWELVPFSFVVDWAYNLGDYFSALSATVGLRHVQTSFSIKETCAGRLRIILPKQYAGRTSPYGPDGNVEYGAFVRRTYATFPFPVAPSIKFPFDSLIDKRLLDSLALLRGGFNSKQLSNRGA